MSALSSNLNPACRQIGLVGLSRDDEEAVREVLAKLAGDSRQKFSYQATRLRGNAITTHSADLYVLGTQDTQSLLTWHRFMRSRHLLEVPPVIIRVMESGPTTERNCVTTPVSAAKLQPLLQQYFASELPGCVTAHANVTPISSDDNAPVFYKSLRACIVCQEEGQRNWLDNQLRLRGVSCESFADRHSALKAVVHDDFDIIYLDVANAALNTSQRHGFACASTPIVLIGASESERLELEKLSLAPITSISKPISIRDLDRNTRNAFQSH